MTKQEAAQVLLDAGCKPEKVQKYMDEVEAVLGHDWSWPTMNAYFADMSAADVRKDAREVWNAVG